MEQKDTNLHLPHCLGSARLHTLRSESFWEGYFKKNAAIPHPRVSVAVTPARLLHQHLQLLLVTTESVHSFGEKRILYHL